MAATQSDTPKPLFTLGIEEEFQIVDPKTRELKAHILEMVAEGETRLQDQFKVEMHQSVVEVGTNICANVTEARAEITRLRSTIIKLAREKDLCIAASGTHPFTHWSNVPITPGARYEKIVRDLQMVARANLVFGLHVHVGVEDNATRIELMNEARYFLPHIFALSVNSPFWCGENTGWHSYRIKVFERFPRTGLPDFFSSWADYDDYVQTLIKSNAIDNPKKIWWDVRPHPFFPTLEYRICDVPMTVEESICMAALFQAVTAKLYKIRQQNLSWRVYRKALINENKQRAARYGTDALLIDFGKKREIPYEALLDELLEFVDDVLDELGSRKEAYYSREIVKKKTGAARQLAIYEKTGSMKAVVDYIIEQTKEGVPE